MSKDLIDRSGFSLFNHNLTIRGVNTVLLLTFFAIFNFAIAQSTSSINAREFFKDGFTLYKERNYAAAAKLFKQGLEEDPSDGKAWQFYGDSLLASGKRIEAKKAYRKSFALASNQREKAVLEAKIEDIKISIVPDTKCKDLVELIDPSLIQMLANKLTEVPETKSGLIAKVDNWQGIVETSVEQCGELYVLWTTKIDSKLYAAIDIIRSISISGYPHLGIVSKIDSSRNTSVLSSVSSEIEPLTTSIRETNWKSSLKSTSTNNSNTFTNYNWNCSAQVKSFDQEKLKVIYIKKCAITYKSSNDPTIHKDESENQYETEFGGAYRLSSEQLP